MADKNNLDNLKNLVNANKTGSSSSNDQKLNINELINKKSSGVGYGTNRTADKSPLITYGKPTNNTYSNSSFLKPQPPTTPVSQSNNNPLQNKGIVFGKPGYGQDNNSSINTNKPVPTSLQPNSDTQPSSQTTGGVPKSFKYPEFKLSAKKQEEPPPQPEAVTQTTEQPTEPLKQSSLFEKGKPLSAGDFFKQLEKLNQINVNTNIDTDKALEQAPEPEESEEGEYDEKKHEILHQLKRLQDDKLIEKEDNKRKKAGFIWILSLSSLLLVAVIIAFILINRNVPETYEYVRISVSMPNVDDVFYQTTVSGDRIPIRIMSGDSYPLVITARNSENPTGDSDAPVWSPVFIRFKVWLTVDGVEKENYVVVNPDEELWHRYDASEEENYRNEFDLPIITTDDGYYYYNGILYANQQLELIDSISFPLFGIGNEDAGKEAILYIQVEVLENAYGISTFWTTAPQAWVNYIDTLLNPEETTTP